MRAEEKIISSVRRLLCDQAAVRWLPDHLVLLFSLGLTRRGIDRTDRYSESDANLLIDFIVANTENYSPITVPDSIYVAMENAASVLTQHCAWNNAEDQAQQALYKELERRRKP